MAFPQHNSLTNCHETLLVIRIFKRIKVFTKSIGNWSNRRSFLETCHFYAEEVDFHFLLEQASFLESCKWSLWGKIKAFHLWR